MCFIYDYFAPTNCSNDPIQSRRGRKKLKQAKLVQFSTYWTETGQGVHYNSTYNMIWPFDCTVLPSYSLKKERLCLKIVLGQAWFELYCTAIFSFFLFTQREHKLDTHHHHNQRYHWMQYGSFILYIYVILKNSPWSKWCLSYFLWISVKIWQILVQILHTIEL